MTRDSHLRAVRDDRHELILDWLRDSEDVNANPVLDLAFARLHGVAQVRPWPWDAVVERLRPGPEPRSRRIELVLVVVALAVTLLVTAFLAGGQRFGPQPAPPTSGPSASMSPRALVYPLADAGGTLTFVDADGTLTLIEPDGTARRRVGGDIAGALAQPDWSPDGSRLLVLERRGGTEQLWDVDPAGSESQVVIPCADPCGARNEAAYSRDGTRIAFFDAYGPDVGGFPRSCGISVYDRASLAITRLTDSPCGIIEERAPRWSPDSKSLVFFRTRSPDGLPSRTNNGTSAVFTRNLETGAERQLTDWALMANEVDWSPDGAWIVVSLGGRDIAPAQSDLWRVRPDGTGLEQLTFVAAPGVHATWPRYTPDGRWILFGIGPTATPNELWAIPSEGGDPVRVLPGVGATGEVVMRPTP